LAAKRSGGRQTAVNIGRWGGLLQGVLRKIQASPFGNQSEKRGGLRKIVDKRRVFDRLDKVLCVNVELQGRGTCRVDR